MQSGAIVGGMLHRWLRRSGQYFLYSVASREYQNGPLGLVPKYAPLIVNVFTI